MTITCPACGKANHADSACARCGCDLTGIRAVLQAAGTALETAKACLRASNWPAALDWAADSWQLYHTPEAAQVAFLAAAAAGDTAGAWHWHQRGAEEPSSV